MISKPVTRPDGPSQRGRAPMSASAWAISSPPVRMFDVPQALRRHRARPVAVGLGIVLDQKLGRSPAELPSGSRRHLARVHRVEVPARRQHVRAPARGRPRRPRRHEAAVQRGEQTRRLGVGARVQRRADGLLHLAQHGGTGAPFGGQAEGAGDQGGGQVLQALDRVAGAAPGRAVGERLRPRALPRRAERGRERIQPEGEVVGQCAQEGSLAGAGAAHAARDRAQEFVAPRGLGRPAEDVEAVANLHLLDLAEIAIELAERVVAVVVGLDAAILVEPDRRGKLQDARAQRRTPARIEGSGVEELVHQPLQLLQRTVAARARQRRRQVIDDHRRPPPLGLAALAGVVDDEGIDVRDRPRAQLPESSLPRAPAPCPAAIPRCRACPHAPPHGRRRPHATRRRRRDSRAAAAGRGRGSSFPGRCCSPAPVGFRRRHCRSAPRGARNTPCRGGRRDLPPARPSARRPLPAPAPSARPGSARSPQREAWSRPGVREHRPHWWGPAVSRAISAAPSAGTSATR